MIKPNELMEKAKRDSGELFWRVREGEYKQLLTDLIHTAHADVFPTDRVYKEVADILDEAGEWGPEDREGFEYSESGLPVYTSDIRAIYGELSPIFESVWDDLSELIHIEKTPSPSEYEQAVVYAYLFWLRGLVANFLVEVKFFNE